MFNMCHLFHRIFSIVNVVVYNVFNHVETVIDKISIQEVVSEKYLWDRRREIKDFTKYELCRPESVCAHIVHNFFPNLLRNFLAVILSLGKDVVKNLDPITANNVLYVAFLPVTPKPSRQEKADRLNEQSERNPLVVLMFLILPS